MQRHKRFANVAVIADDVAVAAVEEESLLLPLQSLAVVAACNVQGAVADDET